MANDPHVIVVEQRDPRLGRQVVHHPANRRHAVPTPRGAVLPQTTFTHRLYNPYPLVGQRYGYCTLVDQANKLNAVGNRRRGRVLDRDWCEKWYPHATRIDPFLGEYPPEDTGSSAWAACESARTAGELDRYAWLFGDATQTVEMLRQRTVGVGTWWYDDMFTPDADGLVEVGGERVGGHQWTLIGWNHRMKAVKGICWWDDWGIGGKGIFYIKLDALHRLVLEDGDRHVTYTS